jgi:LacI family transcriptional regulator
MKERAITLHDIATKLNLSTVTVSKALRNHPDISPKTTKLIKTIADEMGYTPNIMARNLSARRSNTIGVVVPKIAHYFFGAIIEAIYDIAFEHNYEIILTVSQEDAEREKKHLNTLLAMKVDGIIISITQETNDYSIFEMIERRGVPTVFIDRIPEMNIPYNSVVVDDRGGAYKAIEHAIKLGYRKIAHFGGSSKINIGRERLRGFYDAMENYNIEVNKSWVLEGGFGEKYGYENFLKLYSQKNLPDLIFAVTYPVALGVYMAASEVGVKIPEDVDVICFGNANIQKFLSPPLSCINQPTELISKNAMEMIFQNIENKEEYISQHKIVDTDLILRGTCTRFNKQ